MPWKRLVAVASLLLVAAPGLRADDELTQIVQRTKLAAQKLTADVTQALAQSRTLEKADPEAARGLLERTLGQVRDSQDLGDEQRAALAGQLNVRLRQIAETARARQVAQEQAAQRERLPRPEPTGQAGPAGLAQDMIAGRQAQLDAERKLRGERERGYRGVIRSVEDSAVPQAETVTFAKNWKEVSELRKKMMGPQLSAKEVALLKTLNSTLSVDFKDTKFRDVLDYLGEKTGLSLIVDEGSLKDANVDYDDSVTFKAQRVAVRTLLRKILADRGLSYVLKEGTVQVVTTQKARDMMVVRTYPVDDLIAPSPFASAYGPFAARAQMLSNVQSLIQTIQNSYEPAMWNVNGGPAAITFHEPGMALVIRAPAELHYSLGSAAFGR